ncbi:FAD-binding protein [Raoultibacter timonensis]|uniref:FAD-binding dehydrogenase n=1 Tax=Raoultibacter timonensis TaxID=1907662 RepID=A0ABN6MJ93_9ACTN|nr:FAD-binding protein [Raoultibacter timonensis]BDE97328.1 FAD-binding dehydrogenase [Raoultibacter timonensis]BDF51931.1 FAD-binding dehydrogenase [Raoultibacter timonensis]
MENFESGQGAGLSRRSFLMGLALAGSAAAGAGLAGCSPASSTAAAEDGAADSAGEEAGSGASSTSNVGTDVNGNTVYYSMRRDWLGEAPTIADDQVTETQEADIVIVGAGYAGSQCFRMACEKGLTCIVVDTQAKETFETYGGQLGHFNSTWQEEVLGIPKDTFDPVDFIDSYQLQSAGRAHPDLIRQFAHRNGEMVDWMMELQPDLSAVTGVNSLNTSGDYSYKKGYFWTYPAVINLGSGAFETSGAFCTASVDKGIEASPDSQALFGYTAKVLVKDGDAVSGVIVQNDADETYVKLVGAKGVVLATGDFSANSEMYSALCTEVQESNPYTQLVGSGRDGYGIRMGMWAGGVMELGPRAAMGGCTSALPMGTFGAASGLWINKYGKRYCNEAFGVPFVAGVQSARQPIDSSIIQVWDNGHWREFAQNQALGHFNLSDISDAKMDELAATLQSAVDAGATGVNESLFAADTLEELAGYLGFEGEAADNFVEAVQTYDAYAAAGKDDDYAKPADMMFRISEPPYFAEKLQRNANIVLVTLSGLFIDGDGRCLDQNFEPIEGLYATGNASGGRFPLQYTAPMNGISIGFATVFGALLGEHLAEQA